MALNLAENIAPATWFSPLAAPVGAIPIYLASDVTSGFMVIEYLWGTVILAYLYMALIVMPIFLISRKRVSWTIAKVISLGGISALLPLLVTFFWVFIDELVRGDVMKFLLNTWNRDWTLFRALLGAGLAVSVAYAVIQTIARRTTI